MRFGVSLFLSILPFCYLYFFWTVGASFAGATAIDTLWTIKNCRIPVVSESVSCKERELNYVDFLDSNSVNIDDNRLFSFALFFEFHQN